jgi:predicted HTH domain antitoxin
MLNYNKENLEDVTVKVSQVIQLYQADKKSVGYISLYLQISKYLVIKILNDNGIEIRK